MLGKTLSHYKVLEKIGQGGMGEVYRAEDTNLSREVAIKVLPEQFTKDPQRLARFEREAKLLASLNHPNIAAIYGLEEADGVLFLSLEEVIPGISDFLKPFAQITVDSDFSDGANSVHSYLGFDFDLSALFLGSAQCIRTINHPGGDS